MRNNLKETIRAQREQLTAMLGEEMLDLALKCVPLLGNHEELDLLLSGIFPLLPYCKHLYVLNSDGVQITDNITQSGKEAEHFGRNRMDRPYMEGIIGVTDFKLSDAYISKNKKRPSFTAIQVIRNEEGQRAGFLGADFDLRESYLILKKSTRSRMPGDRLKVIRLYVVQYLIKNALKARWINVWMKSYRLSVS
ncbi:MAG: hypothetical protein QM484_00785 [Woeseiaceae bacterium]